jgi:hypothetical protein
MRICTASVLGVFLGSDHLICDLLTCPRNLDGIVAAQATVFKGGIAVQVLRASTLPRSS